MQVKNIRKNYTVLPSDKFLFVHTAVPITITVPKQIPNDVSFIILGSGTESSNNITIAYPNQSDTVISTNNSITVITNNGNDLYSVNSAGAGGGGGVGWTLTPGVTTTLNSAIGLNLGSVSNTADSLNPYSVIDTSTIDVQSSIEDLEIEGQIKIYKAQGANNIILDSLAGFSDGTQTLTIVDSAIIFFDGSIWQILYNNEWKTKVVDIPMGVAGVSGILGMGSNPIELLPAPGVGKYYDVESIITKYTHDTTVYTTFADLAYLIGLNYYNTITGMITIASNSVNKALDSTSSGVPLNQALTISTNDSSDPTLGDGTLQVIIKYKVSTF